MKLYRVRRGWFDRCVVQYQEPDGQWVDADYKRSIQEPFRAMPPQAMAELESRVARADKRAKAQRDARILKAQKAAHEGS